MISPHHTKIYFTKISQNLILSSQKNNNKIRIIRNFVNKFQELIVSAKYQRSLCIWDMGLWNLYIFVKKKTKRNQLRFFIDDFETTTKLGIEPTNIDVNRLIKPFDIPNSTITSNCIENIPKYWKTFNQ